METARDISIIVLAVVSIVVGVLLIFLIVQLQRLIKMLGKEVKPVIDSTNETVSTVRGTTTFLSEHLVSPIIEVAGYAAGVKRVAQVLTGWRRDNDTGNADRPARDASSGTPASSAQTEMQVE